MIKVNFKIADKELSIGVNSIDMAVKMANHALDSYQAEYARISSPNTEYDDYLKGIIGDPRD